MDEKHYEAAIDKLKIGLLWTEKLLEEEIPTVHYTLLNEQVINMNKIFNISFFLHKLTYLFPRVFDIYIYDC